MLVLQNPIRVITNDAQISLHGITSLPVMLDRLAAIDVIALDAAVSSGAMGERARRLLANRRRLSQNLPRLLITSHNDLERQQAQQVATQLRPFATSVTIQDERGRNETAVKALSLHRQYWPDVSEQERKTRIL